MSHARRERFRLDFSAEGSVELTSNGATVWASDADPDFVDEFGDDVLAELDDDDERTRRANPDLDEEKLIDAVLDYLVEAGYLTEAQADRCDVYLPEETSE